MKVSRAWMLVLTALIVHSLAASAVSCTFSDQETASSAATGYVPNVWTQTTRAQFQMGTVGRTDLTTAPDSIVLGSDYTGPGVYALVGGTSQAFYRYNVTSRAWATVASVPVTLGDGASMVYDGSRSVYSLIGGSSTALYRYDVLSNTWVLFATAPGTIGKGGDIAWDGTYLYILRGDTGNQVWRFNPATGAWATLASVPSSVGTGASINVQNGAVYIIKGGATRTAWKYALATSSWAILDNARTKMGAGADTVAGPGGILYGTDGGNAPGLESYNPTTNAWSARATQTYNVGNGGGLAYDGSATIYSMNGNAQRYFYIYNTTLNSWASGPSLPVTVTTGGALVYVPAVRMGYCSSGTFTSVTFDTGATGMRYVQVFWDRVLSSGTTVNIEVRVSDSLTSGAPNGNWQAMGTGVTGTMTGLVGRYVQWRTTLATSDTTTTPQLQEVRIYYYHA